jgi:hypothetical protein
MRNDPVLIGNLPFAARYEAVHARFRRQAAEIRGRAIESGEMVCALLDPNSTEPKHVRAAINKLHRQFSRKRAALLKNLKPTLRDFARPQ